MALAESRQDITKADLIADISAAEHDPYGAAIELITVTLEWALDDGISGGMSQREYNNLDALARTLVSLDPAVDLQPRIA